MYSVGDTLFLDGSYSLHSQWFSFRTVFAAVALGVFFIVYVSIIRTGFAKMADGVYFISNEDEPGPRAAQHIYGESAGKVRFLIRFIGQ